MPSSRPKTLEEVFKRTREAVKGAACREITIHDETGVNTVYERKDIYFCGLLGDLVEFGRKIVIRNALEPSMIVRKITIGRDYVYIDVMDGKKPYKFPATTPVYYEPWFMDRGSYLIFVDEIGDYGKLATEHDIVEVVEE